MEPGLVETLQSKNRQEFYRLAQPNNTESSLYPQLDNDTIREHNARQFYRFELKFPMVNGAYGQIKQYATIRESLGGDGQDAEARDKVGLALEKISHEIKEEVAQHISHIPSLSDQSSEDQERGYNDQEEDHSVFQEQDRNDQEKNLGGQEPGLNDSEQKLAQKTKHIARIGTTEQASGHGYFPSFKDLFSDLEKKTGLNSWIERLIYGGPRQLTFNNAERHGEGAELLYKFLSGQNDSFSDRESCKAQHRGRLKLSDCGESPESSSVYDMFLSCCHKCIPMELQAAWRKTESKAGLTHSGWHKTRCTIESEHPPFVKPIMVWSEVGKARNVRKPLRLSFNNSHLWFTMNKLGEPPPVSLSPRDKIAYFETLDELLGNGSLQGDNRAEMIKRYRLARRLGLTLQALCVGPWLQVPWTSSYVEILRDKDMKPIESLDEAYITCTIAREHQQQYQQNDILAGIASDQTQQLCPEFFLSFAQLLVDIEMGKKVYRHNRNEPLADWYDVLLDTVMETSASSESDPSKCYRDAITGCLYYYDNYRDEAQNINDDKQLKRQVIRKYIVSPLQDNLSEWESMEKTDNDYKDTASGSDTSNNTLNRDSVSQFTLWDERFDHYNELLTDEEIRVMKSPPSGTVTAHILNVVDHVKRHLKDSLSKNPKAGHKKVRIAVIDTGFDDGLDLESGRVDSLLSHPNFKNRVKDRQNFFSEGPEDPDPNDWKDTDGHGTHITRILLRFAPQADIYIARIAKTKSLVLRENRLLEALRWAGDNADIINMSFSLGTMPDNPELPKMINKLVLEKKLIFAAASNLGRNSERQWPANEEAVFCIHATTEDSEVDVKINLQAEGTLGDHYVRPNFATLGCNILSYWHGKDVSITGTSFASPVAAAMAANVLDYARVHMPTNAEQFQIHRNMNHLFLHHMTDNPVQGVYHILKPWKSGLWDNNTSVEEICETLNGIWSTDRWRKRR